MLAENLTRASYGSRYHAGVDTRPSLWLVVPPRYTEQADQVEVEPASMHVYRVDRVYTHAAHRVAPLHDPVEGPLFWFPTGCNHHTMIVQDDGIRTVLMIDHRHLASFSGCSEVLWTASCLSSSRHECLQLSPVSHQGALPARQALALSSRSLVLLV